MLSKAFERRAVSYQQVFGSGGFFGGGTKSGVSIDQSNSLRIATVYACVRLLADTVSTLSWDTYRRRDGVRVPFRPRPIWLDSPDPDSAATSDEFLSQVMVSLLLDGNAFIHVTRSGGDVVALTVLEPSRVEVRRNQSYRIEYALPDVGVVFPKEDIVHIVEMRKPGSLRGVSRIDQLRESLGLTAALDDFAARFFGQGTTTSGIIEVPGALTREQAKDLVDGFEMGHKGGINAHRPGVLFGGAKWSKTGVDPDEAQMLESRRQQVEEIAKVFRVPLHMLSTAIQGAMSYASVEQNAIQFASYTVRPYVTKIENALTKLLPDGVFVRMNMDAILRGDLQSRFNAYSVGTQAGFLSINDIHRLEDMAPVEGGDVYRVPLANINLSAASLTDQQLRVSMASDLIAAGFSPEEVLVQLGLPRIAHTGLPTTKVQSLADNPDVVYP